jgi:hypothetical protein
MPIRLCFGHYAQRSHPQVACQSTRDFIPSACPLSCGLAYDARAADHPSGANRPGGGQPRFGSLVASNRCLPPAKRRHMGPRHLCARQFGRGHGHSVADQREGGRADQRSSSGARPRLRCPAWHLSGHAPDVAGIDFSRLQRPWAVSYQDEALHDGDTYRFDGWTRLARSRSGTDHRSGKRDRNKTIWDWNADPRPSYNTGRGRR